MVRVFFAKNFVAEKTIMIIFSPDFNYDIIMIYVCIMQ